MFIRWSWHVKALKAPIMAAFFFPFSFLPLRSSLAVWPVDKHTQKNNRYVVSQQQPTKQTKKNKKEERRAFSSGGPAVFVCCVSDVLDLMALIHACLPPLLTARVVPSSTIQMGCEKHVTPTGPCIIDVDRPLDIQSFFSSSTALL